MRNSRSFVGTAVVVGMLVSLFAIQSYAQGKGKGQGQGKGSEMRIQKAAKTPPPDLEPQDRPPEAPKNHPSLEELKQHLSERPEGKEKLEKAKAKAPGQLKKASQSPPPDPNPAAAGPPPPEAPKKRPSQQELEQLLQNRPGGKELLEKIKGGFKPTGMGPGILESVLAAIFGVSEAEAQYTMSATTFSTSNPPYPWILNYANGWKLELASTSTTSDNYLNVYGGNVYNNSQYIRTYGTAYVAVKFTVPSNGWYLINVLSYPGRLTLQHYDSSSGQYVNEHVWPGGSGWQNCSTALYLEAGAHYFKLLATNNYYSYIKDVSISQMIY